jgi:DNA-binding MarR family transcriptional regulator
MNADKLIEALRPTMNPGFFNTRHLSALLVAYSRAEPLKVWQMANELDISKPCVSRILDFLGEQGFTARRRDKVDRRDVFITITDKGRAFVASMGVLA